MSVQLNHTIVRSRDRRRSAQFLAEILGLPEARPLGPFLAIELGNGVTFDLYESDSEIASQHYAFLVGEAEFDAIFARIRERRLPYWADPGRERPSEINHRDGGRGVYFEDPDGHLLEALTRPYGSSVAPGSEPPTVGAPVQPGIGHPEDQGLSRPPVPPFTHDTATRKARLAEDAWNTREPARVALAYTEDSRWRNRSEFFRGRAEILAFLTRKWQRELDYRLIKEVWAFTGDRIAVRFAYEFHDQAFHWFRAHGNEQWEFDGNGLMRRREASINDVPIQESERLFRWPLGPRPAGHPGLTELGL